jgi:PAS domain S-box-containing protein
MKVLFVEDYPIGAAVVRDTLRRRAADIELDMVQNVAEALARLVHYAQRWMSSPAPYADEVPRYDLVLTDMNLPDGLGLEVLSHVRSNRLPLAVVILTGSNDQDTVIGALHAGANDYLTKDSDYLTALPATLRAALARFRAENTRAATPLHVIYAEADATSVGEARKRLARRAPNIVLEATPSAAALLARLRAPTTATQPTPDVLLLDHRLPGMPIIELLKAVEGLDGPSLPVVLVAALGEEQVAQVAIQFGAADYLIRSEGYLQRLPFAIEGAHLKAASLRERAALRQSESEFRTLVENMPDLVARFDRDLLCAFVSPVVAELSGHPPAYYVGKHCAELGLPGDQLPHLVAAMTRVMAGGGREDAEFDVGTSAGVRSFETVLTPELDVDAKVQTVLVIAHEITERKRAEAAARDSERLARTTLDALTAELAILDETGRIIAVNRAWREFAAVNGSLESGDFEGTNYLDVCDATSADCGYARDAAAGIRAVLRTDAPEFLMEYPCDMPDGLHWFSARVTRFPGADSLCVVVAHEDITERRRSQERLAHYRDHLEAQVAERTQELDELNLALTQARDQSDAANRAKSSFLATMSHEIRTPVSSIIGLARLMRADVTAARPLGYLGKLQQSADHLLQIVNDVLDLSKIEAEQLDLGNANFNLHDSLAHAMELLQERADDKGLHLALAIDARLPEHLHGDALRLEQIVINFLTNAIKFTSAGVISVRATLIYSTVDSTELRIEVQDSGIGMTPAQQERLFQAFSQADGSISSLYGGTGLGLVIAQRLAALMNGRVGAISEAGVGSTFWMTARLGQAVTMPGIHQGGSAEVIATPQSFSGLRVLLAEDDPVHQLVTSETLKQLGFEVDTVENGVDAVTQVRSTTYALVIMDVQMPLMDGLEASRAIRRLPERHSLPIIAMTANAFDDDVRRCLQAGMDEHVSKPINLAKLREVLVRKLFQKPREA